MLFIQRSTISLPVLQRLCSESSIMCIDACYDISVKREEDSDIDCRLLRRSVSKLRNVISVCVHC